MVPASPSPDARPGRRLQRALRRRSRWGWPMWLFIGACFGLGYGFTQRLMRINVSGAWQGNQLFGVKPFPGTSLSSLRERAGDQAQQIRGDLDLLELERQKQIQEKELARREAELKRRDEEAREREQREAEKARLEALERQAVPEPQLPPIDAAPIESPLLSPPESVPPPPEAPAADGMGQP